MLVVREEAAYVLGVLEVAGTICYIKKNYD